MVKAHGGGVKLALATAAAVVAAVVVVVTAGPAAAAGPAQSLQEWAGRDAVAAAAAWARAQLSGPPRRPAWADADDVVRVGRFLMSHATGWAHPEQSLEALWPLQSDLRPWSNLSASKAAYAIATVPCPAPATWWTCDGYRVRRDAALDDLDALATLLGYDRVSLPLLLAVFSGQYLRSVTREATPPAVALEPARQEQTQPQLPPQPLAPATVGLQGPALPTSGVWVDLPTPLLIPPDPGIQPGVYSGELPMSLWLQDLVTSMEPALTAALRRRLITPLEGLAATTMRTREGDLYFLKVQAVSVPVDAREAVMPLVNILHIRVLCRFHPAITDHRRCQFTGAVHGMLTVNSPLRYFNAP